MDCYHNPVRKENEHEAIGCWPFACWRFRLGPAAGAETSWAGAKSTEAFRSTGGNHQANYDDKAHSNARQFLLTIPRADVAMIWSNECDLTPWKGGPADGPQREQALASRVGTPMS